MVVPVVERTTVYIPSIARDLLARAEELFGREFLQKLREVHERGLSSHTPAKYPHRLARCIQLTRRAISSTDTNSLLAMSELGAVLELFEPWRGDPTWPKLLRSLEDPNVYTHTVIALAAARHLTSDDQKAGLCPEAEGRRSYDIRIVKSSSDYILAVEIKTPAELRRQWYPDRGRSFRETEATKIISKALKSVGKGDTAQLGGGQQGILVIGGFFPSKAEIQLLGKATDRRLRTSEGRDQLIGILVVGIGVTKETAVWTPEFSLASIKLYSQERLSSWAWYTPNPKYIGDAIVITD